MSPKNKHTNDAQTIFNFWCMVTDLNDSTK